MLKNDILEESFSPYVNPLTLVVREMKPLCICFDARIINRQMTADRTKVLPLRELLQKFNSAKKLNNWRFSPPLIFNKGKGISVPLHTNRVYGQIDLYLHSFLIFEASRLL
jgi:hypothetical protein